MGKVFDRRSSQPSLPDGVAQDPAETGTPGGQEAGVFSPRPVLPPAPLAEDASGPVQPGVVGIVVAGVHRWGESTLEQICPRALLPVVGRPLVSYGLEWLHSGGVRCATVCANCETGAIRAQLGDGGDPGIALDYYEDVMPRGPAGCLRDAAVRSEAQTFVVMDGSIVTMVDLRGLLAAHAASGASLTVVVSGPERHEELNGRPLEPVGMYVVSRPVIEHITVTGYQDLKQVVIPRLYDRGLRVVPHIVPESTTVRVTNAASYAALAGRMVEYAARSLDLGEEYRRVEGAWVHRSCELEATSRLVGDVVIGPGCVVGEGVTIVGPTSIGSGCVLESQAVVTRCVIWSDCRVGRGAFVDRSILTDGAEVEPELAMRETVWSPVQRQTAGFLNRMRWFRPAPTEPVKQWNPHPIRVAPLDGSEALSRSR